MPLVLNLTKLWGNFRGYGPVTPNEGDLGKILVPVAPLPDVMGQEHVTGEGVLTDVQPADSVIRLLTVTSPGWWLMQGSVINAAGAAKHILLIKGSPVLGSLLTIGALIHYQLNYLIPAAGSIYYTETRLLFCPAPLPGSTLPVATQWEWVVRNAMIAGDNLRATINLTKFYVE